MSPGFMRKVLAALSVSAVAAGFAVPAALAAPARLAHRAAAGAQPHSIRACPGRS